LPGPAGPGLSLLGQHVCLASLSVVKQAHLLGFGQHLRLIPLLHLQNLCDFYYNDVATQGFLKKATSQEPSFKPSSWRQRAIQFDYAVISGSLVTSRQMCISTIHGDAGLCHA
jgi:hypothetical protein